MAIIDVLNLVPDCYTWINGDIVRRELQAHLEAGATVTLSFEGVRDVPTSFVNAAFVPLLDSFGLDFIKKNISIVRSNRQINNLIKHRLEFEAKRKAAIPAS